MNIACCPYCNSDGFSSDVIRADGVDVANPEKYAQIEGYWFNQCISCAAWSVYKDGQQFEIDAKTERPIAYSLPPVV